MNLSGILVVAAVEHIDKVLAQLRELSGVEVHEVDHAGGRIVVVQEAQDVDAEVAGFMRIRTLPHVLAADLVCHYFGEQAAAEPNNDSALAALAAPVAAGRAARHP